MIFAHEERNPKYPMVCFCCNKPSKPGQSYGQWSAAEEIWLCPTCAYTNLQPFAALVADALVAGGSHRLRECAFAALQQFEKEFWRALSLATLQLGDPSQDA